MKKFISKILLYSSICLILVNTIGFVGFYSLQKSTFYKPSYLINQFKENTYFDYFILGSSRGLTTLDSKFIDQNSDLKGVNISMDDTDLKSHLLMFKHFVNNGFKSKYCILTLDTEHFTTSNQNLGNNDYRFAPFTHKNYIKDHYRKYERTGLKPLFNSNTFPFLSFSYYNLELLPPAIISALKPKYRSRFDEYGNYTYPNSEKFKGVNQFKPKSHTIQNPLIKEMFQIAQQNQIELFIYIAPYKNKKVIINNSFIDKNHIINHSDKINDASLFYDYIHVNSNGRKIASNIFVKEFKTLID